MFNTIKAKFILVILTIIILGVGIPNFFLLQQFRSNFAERSIILLETSLNVARNGLVNCMNTHGKKDIPNILESVSENEWIDHARIVDTEGTILYSLDHREEGKSFFEIDSEHKFGKTRLINLIEDKGVYSATEPIFNTSQCQTCHDPSQEIIAYLDIDTRLTSAENRFYTGTIHSVYLGIAILFILFVVLYILFNKFINNPLKKFMYALDEVEAGNLNIRLPQETDDEFGIIEKHFNKMVNNLKDSKRKIEELHFEQLQHADKLATLGELTAEIAHEINNPSAIILSRVDYLQIEAKENENLKKFDEDLNVIANQIDRVSAITSNILRYSKKLSKEFQKVNLAKIVNESLEVLHPRVRKKRVIIKKSIPDEEIFINADQVQIEQMIINLVNNAVDAIEEDGIIDIKLESKNGKAVLKISDNGKGIEQELLDQIYSPFFTTKEKDKGTGLGLYIVNNIIKNHNAEIRCSSKINEGTEFKISFNRIINE